MNLKAIKQIRRKLLRNKLHGLLITKQVNVAYLSGFKGEGQLLLTPISQVLIVDPRFTEQAARSVKTIQIYQRREFASLAEALGRIGRKMKLKRIGFEANSLSYQCYARLKRSLQPIKLLSTTNIIENLRAIKTAQEIKLITQAAVLANKSYNYALRIIKPKKKEKQLAIELQYFMKKNGAEDSAFDIIVASGKRAAMPHAVTTSKAIASGAMVLLDLGCRISGYNSDLTRMIFLDKIRGKIRRIYNVVLQAQEQALKGIKAGVEACQIDNIARQFIAKEGLGNFFGHALGHGIGREVHEYPAISPRNHDLLKEGMIFTVEPGIYIPGWGGVRVEDMVLVTKTGSKVLTR